MVAGWWRASRWTSSTTTARAGRRLTFQENRYTDYDAPRLVVRLLSDQEGTPYLLLAGPEPDIRWEAFARAVRRVVEHFDVRLVVSLGSVPMAVPHTRPVQLTNHATSDHLLTQENVWRGELRVPSSAQALLELRLGEWGVDALGCVAHIPHYVAQLGYPLASVALLDAIGSTTGLSWDVETLREAGTKQTVEIESQLSESGEVRDVVRGLEQQYDAFHRAAETPSPTCSPRRADAVRRRDRRRSSSSSSPGSTTSPTAGSSSAGLGSAEELVELLDLETIDDNLFRGTQPDTVAAAGLRRPGRGARAGGGDPHRARRVRRALAALATSCAPAT